VGVGVGWGGGGGRGGSRTCARAVWRLAPPLLPNAGMAAQCPMGKRPKTAPNRARYCVLHTTEAQEEEGSPGNPADYLGAAPRPTSSCLCCYRTASASATALARGGNFIPSSQGLKSAVLSWSWCALSQTAPLARAVLQVLRWVALWARLHRLSAFSPPRLPFV
jgi:hypothetical protein